MVRFGPLVIWALGRSPYEDEVIDTSDGHDHGDVRVQEYNHRGHPRNPETRRRERAQIRAANEVMEVTGIVQDFTKVKAKSLDYMREGIEETYTGMSLLEVGRVVLVGGVWGVLGLRRRILVSRKLIIKAYSF